MDRLGRHQVRASKESPNWTAKIAFSIGERYVLVHLFVIELVEILLANKGVKCTNGLTHPSSQFFILRVDATQFIDCLSSSGLFHLTKLLKEKGTSMKSFVHREISVFEDKCTPFFRKSIENTLNSDHGYIK